MFLAFSENKNIIAENIDDMVEENLENIVEEEPQLVTPETIQTSTVANSVRKALSEMLMLDESSDADLDFEFDLGDETF